jgi:DNA-binding LacI/PurR family transcriptional regulator
METSRSKNAEIARQLRAEVASGKYGAEGRLPSEAQLVKRFGVSRPTVGQALRALESEGLVSRRAGSGTYAQPAGRAPVAAGRLLALLIPDLGNTEIFQLICGELASLARVHDYSLVWGGSGQPRLDPGASLETARELCRHYIEQRVSGVFFAPYELLPGQESANRDMAVMLRDAGVQVILLDRDLSAFPQRNDFDVVGVDNIAAGWQLADHLIRLGCRRLQFVSRPFSAPTVQARIAGAREAIAQHRIECADDWVREGEPGDVKFVRSLLVPNRPDAFICANDHTAALLMRSLAQLKVSVPREVRVVGMDDVKFATLVSPALTTMQQPCREIAITAFRAMSERLADPTLPARRITLASRLVVRDSCGAYLPRKSR